MFILLLLLIIIRPFICSTAFPEFNLMHSIALATFLASWIFIQETPLWDDRRLTTAVLLFIAALLFSLIPSHNKLLSALTLLQYLNGILLFFVCRSLAEDQKNTVIITLILTAVFISFLDLNQFFSGFQNIKNYLNETKTVDPVARNFIAQQRVFTPFITPNTLAGYLIMIIPLALTLKDNAWVVLPLFFALLLSKSIGAIVCLLTATAIFFAFKQKKEKDSTITLLITVLLIGLFTLAAAIFALRTSSQFQHFQPDYSMRMRLSYWLQTALIIKEHLLFGIGLGHLDLINARYAHNNFLQLWAETGLAGFASFIFLITTLIRSGFRALETAADKPVTAGLLCGSLAFLLHNCIDFTFFFPETCFIWCILLGLLLNKAPQQIPSQHSA